MSAVLKREGAFPPPKFGPVTSKVVATPIDGVPNGYYIKTEYTYRRKLPKYMHILYMRLLADVKEFKEPISDKANWTNFVSKGVVIYFEEVSMISCRLQIKIIVPNVIADVHTANYIEKVINGIYRKIRLSLRKRFIEYITREKIKYKISRKII